MSGRPWTQEEESLIVRLMNEGYTRQEIVKISKLNRSASSIYTRISILKHRGNGNSKYSPLSVAERKEREGIKKNQIERLKKKFHIGQKVYGIRYSTLDGIHSARHKVKGVIIGLYPHIVRMKPDKNNWTECFNYRDLRIVGEGGRLINEKK